MLIGEVVVGVEVERWKMLRREREVGGDIGCVRASNHAMGKGEDKTGEKNSKLHQ